MCVCCAVFTSLKPRGVCVIYTHKLYAGACVLWAAIVIDIVSVPGIGISTALAPCLPLSLPVCVCLWQFQRIRRLSAQGHDSVTPACRRSPLIPTLLLLLPLLPLLLSLLLSSPLLCIDFAYKLKFARVAWFALCNWIKPTLELGQSLTAFLKVGVAV